jgi:Ca2+/H+ antiporter
MATVFTNLGLVFGLALLATGGGLTFTRRPLAGGGFIVFGAFVTLFTLMMATPVTTSEGSPRESQPHELVSTTPGPD